MVERVSSPLVSTIVPVTPKLSVSPDTASAMTWRNEPAPESFVVVMVRMAAFATHAWVMMTAIISTKVFVFIDW